MNEKFAEVTLKALRKTLDDRPDNIPIVWIHDYHLMLAANTIRQVLHKNMQIVLYTLLEVIIIRLSIC